MTQVAVALDPRNVVMVADRRLINLSTGEPVDDETCKMVVEGRRLAWAYTGLANVKPAPRGETGLWLCDRLTGAAHPVVDDLERVRQEATQVFSRIAHLGPRAKRHAFVAAGWDEEEVPFAASISNALLEKGVWADHASKDFVLRRFCLQEEARALFVYGQPENAAGRAVLQRAQDIMAGASTGEQVLRTLIQFVRANASKNSAIGPGLLGMVLPRTAIGASGGFSLMSPNLVVGGTQPAEGLTAIYVPSGSEELKLYAPHYVEPNMAVAGLTIHDRMLSPDEIQRRYEGGGGAGSSSERGEEQDSWHNAAVPLSREPSTLHRCAARRAPRDG
jgi:hypothetical protein